MSLRNNDLKQTIEPHISIDEFSPKSGTDEEIIVVGFYAIDEGPAKDLDDFVEKSPYDVIDVDVSPNPDEEGRYMIFVEFKRNIDFFIMLDKVVKDIENLTGEQNWQVSTRNLDYDVPFTDPELRNAVEVDPTEFIDDQDINDVQIKEFFKNSYLDKAQLNEGKLEIQDHLSAMSLTFIDLGNEDTLVEKHHLATKPIELLSHSYEIRKLRQILGEGWIVTNMKDLAAIHNRWSDKILLVGGI